MKKQKRIQVTLRVTIPADWTIGRTEKELVDVLRRFEPEIFEQRIARD